MPSGWLYLEAQKRKEWMSRFFILDEGYLRYFIDDDDLDPVATINVKGIEAKAVGQARAGKYAFRLNVTKQADGRYKYVLAGESEAESKQWLTWLAEEGVSVPSMKLSAKPVKLSDSLGAQSGKSFSFRTMSFRPASGKNNEGGTLQRGDSAESGFMSFLSFRSKRKEPKSLKAAKSTDSVDSTSAKPSTTTPSGKHVSMSEDVPPHKLEGLRTPSQLVRQPSSKIAETPPHERSLLIPTSSVEMMADEGVIDGDKPFNEVVESMSRKSFVEAARELSKSISSPGLMGALNKAQSFKMASTKEPAASGADDDAESDDNEAFDDVDDQHDQPVGGDGDGAVLAAGDGESVDGGGSLAEPSEGPTARPTISQWGSMAEGMQAADAAAGTEPTEGDDMDYGSNVSPRATKASAEEAATPTEAGAASVEEGYSTPVPPPAVETVGEAAPEEVKVEEGAAPEEVSLLNKMGSAIKEARRSISDALTPKPPPPTEETHAILTATPLTEEDNQLPLEDLCAKFAANVMASAIQMSAPPRRPSLIARVSAAIKKEEPKPPPKPTFVDTPEEAMVRTWLKSVFMQADQPKMIATFSDNTSSLRDHLRNGLVLCNALNALKPGAVGKVKPPSATASRFARLEALNTYKRACASLSMADKDCLTPDEWLDGTTMKPLLDHLVILTSRVKGAPKFDGPGGARKAPTKGSNRGSLPSASARDIMNEKTGSRTAMSKGRQLSAVSPGAASSRVANSAWQKGASNAAAARAVFEIEKGATVADATKQGAREMAAAATGKVTKQSEKVSMRTATGATHSFAESETIAYTDYINEALGEDNQITHLLPIKENSLELFDALKDGVILCKLINHAQADTIDMRCVHTGAKKPLSVYEVVENLNMAINAAVAIGCRVVNIGHDDVMSGSPHLVLGLLWQIVKAGIMAKINLKASPELMQLLGGAEDMEALKALMALPPEKVLLKWINFQQQRVAPGAKEVTNFGAALKDCSVYANLLHAVAPPDQQHLVGGLAKAVAREPDPLAKAQLIIDTATQLGVTQFKVFAADITKGNEKLNMGFMAAIFNQLPGLIAPAEQGYFAAALAHPKAKILQSGHAAKIDKESGVALLGAPMAPKTGKHWVELRVLEATPAVEAHIGLMPEGADKASVFGTQPASLGMNGGGELKFDGATVHADSSGAFQMGDLIRVEYDSDKGTVTYLKNGETLPHPTTTVAAKGEKLLFGIGRTAGVVEMRIEGSSFVSQETTKLPTEDEGDSREERAFRMWINSLGIDMHVSDLPTQVRDGLLLLQLMDAIQPGVVDWSKVTKKPKNVHAKVINCNYAVQLGKSAFGFSLVGIQGKDIQDGIVKLVLALTWQLMRHHVIKFLSSVSNKQLNDKDVVSWANAKVGDTAHPITKLSDGSLASGVYVLRLLKAVAPRSVDWDQVTPGVTAEDRKLNARLAVSCARKAGCQVFLLWEDIVECKPKMLLVFFATLMQLDMAQEAKLAEGGSMKGTPSGKEPSAE